MKNFSVLTRILAVIAAVLMCVCFIGNYALDSERLEEQREELQEEMEEHKEMHRSQSSGISFEEEEDDDDDECQTCENYEDREKEMDRDAAQNLFYLFQSIALYAVIYSGLLFALGEIASKIGQAKAAPAAPVAVAAAPVAAPVAAPAPAAPAAPVAPVAPVCPQCGSPKQPGARFCGVCGTTMDN